MSEKTTVINSVITDNIDIWTSAIKKKSATGRGSSKKIELYGIKKLRELIFELAVRGKLVQQDPTDEPAFKLLKSIKEEKAQLIKDKKTKNTKPIDTEFDKPYVLPTSWVFAELDTLALLTGGFAFKSSQYTQEGTRVIRISDFDERGLKDDKVVRHEYNDKLEPFLLEPKDLLMAMTGGTVGKSLLLDELPEPLIVNQRVAGIRLLKGINPRFIKYVLQSQGIQRVIEEAKNSTNDNISMGDIRSFLIPLPPEKHQAQVVSKIDELMALCDQLESQTENSIAAHKILVEELLATLTNAKDSEELNQSWQRISEHFDTLFTTEHSIDQLKKTVLQLAVMGKIVPQDPTDVQASVLLDKIAVEKEQLLISKVIKKQKELPLLTKEENSELLPKGWKKSYMQDLCSLITDGTHQTPLYVDQGRPFVSAQCVKPFKFLPDKCRYVSEEHYQAYIKNRKPEQGDILLARVGAGIGEAAVIDIDLKFAIYVSTGLLKPFNTAISSKFLVLWLNSPTGRSFSETNTLGKGVSQGNLNLSLIRRFVVSVPPLTEQYRIVAKVDSLMDLCNTLQTRIYNAQATQNILADTIGNDF